MTITKGELLDSWQEGVEAGARAVDLFAEEIVSGKLVASEIADLAGVDTGLDQFKPDLLVGAFAAGFLDTVADAVKTFDPKDDMGPTDLIFDEEREPKYLDIGDALDNEDSWDY